MATVKQGRRTSDSIREAAADLFYRQGYEATSLRQVAAEVGIQVGSLYNHMGGKEELLVEIMTEIMDDLLSEMERVLAGKSDPLERLRLAVGCHIHFHASRARDVFIGNSELRALPPQFRAGIVERRDAYEAILRSLVREAARATGADVLDEHLQVYSIVALGTHVAAWYRPDGLLTLERISEVYTELIFRQMGLPSAPMAPAQAPAKRSAARSPLAGTRTGKKTG